MSPVPTQGVYDFDGEDYAANPNKYDDGVMAGALYAAAGLPLFGFQELLHDVPLLLAEVKQLREENQVQWRQLQDLQEEINVLLRGDEE